MAVSAKTTTTEALLTSSGFRPAGLDELVVGFPFGAPTPIQLPVAAPGSPRDVLVDRIGEALPSDRPALVQFSGGVDSSLVLCVATMAARLRSYPDPVPLTYRFPGLPRTDETSYQELVVAHLGLSTWRIEELTDEHDLVGPPALETLAETGILFPPTLAAKSSTLARLSGEVVLSGEGGDSVFGERRTTNARLLARAAVHREWPKVRKLAPRAAGDLAPRRRRLAKLRSDFASEYHLAWLREPARSRLLAAAVEEDADEPLRPSAYFEHHLSVPLIWVHRQNARAIRERAGVRLVTPFFDEVFLASMAERVPWHHWTRRAEIMERYFADLLPEAIIRRHTKAEFTGVYVNRHTRAFVERWDGTGLPDEIDAAWLKAHWTSGDRCHAGTQMLLQMAALHEAGVDYVPAV